MSREISRGTSDQIILVALLSIRLVNALSTRTFFQPDEYYQALEPAWYLAFNQGQAWITWEWHQHLRSALHPALISSAYYVVTKLSPRFASSDAHNDVLLLAPKIVQSVIAALGDFYTWKLSRKIYGSSQCTLATLCLTVLSPWQWFCSTRTFSNGLESTLTIVALYHWPFEGVIEHTALEARTPPNKKHVTPPQITKVGSEVRALRGALILAALATIMRPTNILIWLSLTLLAIQTSRQRKDAIATVLAISKEGTICGTFALTLSVLVDRLFYGAWAFPPLNFLYFNVVQSLAVFYGNNDWHYYLSQGYPLLLTTAVPFALVGLWRVFSNSPSIAKLPLASKASLKGLAMISLVLPTALSILSHKEVRFVYPILGPLHIIAAGPLVDFFGPVLNSTSAIHSKNSLTRYARGFVLLFIVTLNAIIAGYTARVHNSGLIALPEYLRNEFATHYMTTTNQVQTTTSSTPYNMTVAILMPCHSLPWRSHLLNAPTLQQPGIQAWALTCEPPLHLTTPQSKAKYLDEADIFYADPTHWLRRTMSRQPPWTFAPNPSPPHRPPGLYTDTRTKKLWGGDDYDHDPRSSRHDTAPGLDITDLLPQLRTAPGRAPGKTEDMITRRPWPHYLAFFAQLEPTLVSVLQGSGYTECWRGFNSHWHDDWRRTGDVVVWCLFPERAQTQTHVKDSGGIGVGSEIDAKRVRDRAKKQHGGFSGEGKEQTRLKVRERAVGDRPGKQTVIRADG